MPVLAPEVKRQVTEAMKDPRVIAVYTWDAHLLAERPAPPGQESVHLVFLDPPR